MKHSRRDRIMLELLGPPLLGGTMAAIWFWAAGIVRAFGRNEPLDPALAQVTSLPLNWLVFSVFAFPMIGLQAACYAGIMEYCFSVGLSPRSWRSIALSTLLGYGAGMTLALGYGYDRKDTWYLFSGVGPLVGATLGLLIQRATPRR